MKINALKDTPVILVCRREKRSAATAALLHEAGFGDVWAVRGGLERWIRDSLSGENCAGPGQISGRFGAIGTERGRRHEGRTILLAAVTAGGIAVTAVGTAGTQGMQGDMAPGMMLGDTSPETMAPCMGQGSTGQGMMHEGMGQGMTGSGMMGPGMMRDGTDPGRGALFGSRVTPMMNLSVEDVPGYLALQLDRLNNKRLKVGDIKADDGTITADIVTVDNSLVQRLKVDRRTGVIDYQN